MLIVSHQYWINSFQVENVVTLTNRPTCMMHTSYTTTVQKQDAYTSTIMKFVAVALNAVKMHWKQLHSLKTQSDFWCLEH